MPQRHTSASCASGSTNRACSAISPPYVSHLGQELCELGRYEEAEALAHRGHQLAEETDVTAQASWRQVQARVLAHRGEYTEAERLAREALAITEDTDGLNDQGEALCDLAEILLAAGRDEEAADALAAALERFERKENIPMARRTRTRLMALRVGTSSV